MNIKAKTKLLVIALTYLLLMAAFGAKASEPTTVYSNLEVGWSDGDILITFDVSGSYPDKYILIIGQGDYVSAAPQDGVTYSSGQSFGSGEVLSNGTGHVISDGVWYYITGHRFSADQWSAGQDVWLRIYPYNEDGGIDYKTDNPGELVFVAPGLVEEPYMQPTNFQHTVSGESNGEVDINFSFTASDYALSFPFSTRYLITYKIGSAPTYEPTDGDPDVTGFYSYVSLGNDTYGKEDQNINDETLSINVTDSEQTVYFKIFAFNEGQFDNVLNGEHDNSKNFLTYDPLTASVTIPARANSAPTASDQTINIANDVMDNDVIGNIGATDAEGDPISYFIISGNTDDAFSIDEDGDIIVADASALDFDNWTDYALSVEINDGTDYDMVSVTIAYNQPPVWNLTSAAAEYREEDDWIEIGHAFYLDATDPDGSTMSQEDLTFSIVAGDEDDEFMLTEISGGYNYLVAREALDYEVRNEWVITVRATDEEGAYADVDITITIYNINDNYPEVEDATFVISEEVVNDDVVGTVTTFDADGDDVSLSIIEGDESPYAFRFSGNDLVVNNAFLIDFENWTDYVLTVQARDPSLINENTATITVTLNQPPVFNFSSTNFIYDEGSVSSSIDIQVSDANQDAHTLDLAIIDGDPNNEWAIYADEFSIELYPVSAELDYETTPQYNLTIQATDDQGSSATVDITIDVNNLNDNAPVAEDASYNLPEDAENGYEIGLYTATDLDNDVLTYTITDGNDDNVFVLDASSGSLIVNDASRIDMGVTPSYSLTFEVSDGTYDDHATITVTVQEIAATAPEIDDQTFSIAENSANGSVVGTIEATDINGDAITYSITAGNTSDAFEIGVSTGILTVANADALDFETIPTFSLTVQASDGALSNAATITVNLEDVNENVAPNIADQTFSIAENSANGTIIGTVVASDDNGDAMAFSITAGNTSDAFAITETAGELSVANVDLLDYETMAVFSLTVEVSDGALSSSATITINLEDVEEPTAPTIEDQTFSIEENSANGTSVGTVEASDANGDDITFTIISGNLEDAFLIGNTSGNLLVNNTDALDFEATPTFELVVEVSDGGLSAEATITINLIDIQDPAPPTIADQLFTIDENSANGTSLGIISASDPNEDDITFSILEGNTGDGFLVGSTSGELLVANTEALDYEVTPVFELIVEATDGELSATATITIELNDLDDPAAPTVADQSFSIAENSASGTSLGTIEANDANGDDISFTILSGNTDGAFLIGSTSGELLVSNSEALDFETTPTFELIIEVSDGELTATATITINLIDDPTDFVTSTKDLEERKFKVFPNPTSQFFSLTDNSPETHIRIFNQRGGLAQEFEYQPDNQYMVSHLPKGIYFMMISVGHENHNNKIVIR